MAFKKGQVANLNGRPKGVPDRRNAYRQFLEPRAPELMLKAVELALQGDTQALRLCLERLLPAIKAQDTPVALGAPLSGSVGEQGRVVLTAVGAGRVTPDEAATLMSALAA
jgi:Family of unknown function (DUF5681)